MDEYYELSGFVPEYIFSNHKNMKFYADEIYDRLWLGNYVAAYNKTFLEKNNIKLIVNCTKDIPFPNVNKGKIACIRIPVDDDKSEKEFLKNHILYASEIIHKFLLDGHGVLVHCQMGINRSATVLGSTAILKFGFSSQDVINRLIKYSSPVFTNPYTIDILNELESTKK